MKQKLQKYLSGEREGFSLVELIIVIAIMAILIGIVALAVIPYLEKSRVGKDQQTVDTVYSAFQTTIADQKVTANARVEIKNGADAVPSGAADDAFVKALAEALSATDKTDLHAGTSDKLESADAKGQSIICNYDATNKTIQVWAGAADYASAPIKSSNKAN